MQHNAETASLSGFYDTFTMYSYFPIDRCSWVYIIHPSPWQFILKYISVPSVWFRPSPCCTCSTHNMRIYPWHNWQDHYKILHQGLWLPPPCATLHTQVSSKPSAAHLHKALSLAPTALTEPDVQCCTTQGNTIIRYAACTHTHTHTSYNFWAP